MYYNNTWGTVCPTGWDLRDAHVICKMLGYLYAVESQSLDFYRLYGISSSKVRWLNNVQCNGLETNITECLHDGWFEHSCQYNQDIVVKCFGKPVYTINYACHCYNISFKYIRMYISMHIRIREYGSNL